MRFVLIASAFALGLWTGSLPMGNTPTKSGLKQTYTTKKPRPTGPMAAYEWKRLAWKDEFGVVAPRGYEKAMSQRTANIAAQGGIDRDATGLNWTFRGPNNIGGRTRSLLIDPNNPDILFAGSVGGGIWRSTDGGTTWNTVSDRLHSLAIGCLTRDPNNPNTLYAGIGEGYFNGDAVTGSGIYKSKDNGLTWALMPSTSGFDNTCRIAVQPDNSNVILVSTRYGGIQRSVDGGANWTTPRWAQGSFFVAFDPNNPNKAIAQIIDYDFGTNQWFHNALYSVDAGVTWQDSTGMGPIFDFSGRIELAYAPTNTNTVYAVAGINGGKIYRSTDGGHTYSLRTTSGTTGTDWYRAPIWIDPTNSNNIVAGSYHVNKSTDGGISVNEISNGYILTADPHPDIHYIVSHPDFDGVNNKTVYVCTDGGVFKTDDIYSADLNDGWVPLFDSYKTVQYYGAAGHGASGRITGGTQDNGTHTFNTGNTNALLTYGGDGGFSAISPVNNNYIYGEYVYLTIHRSTNGGVSANDIYSGITDAFSDANFIAPFVLDPTNAARMYAGGGKLWRSNNVTAGSPSWTSIRARGTDVISAICPSAATAGIVWVGQNDGVIQKTTNATATTPTWTVIDNNSGTNPLPDRYVTRIVISPHDANTIYAAFGGWTTNNLWKSTNNGSTWAPLMGTGASTLPDAPIRGFAVHPTNPLRLYAGTEVGLFTSGDGGQNWSTTNFGPANVAIYEVNFMSGSSTLLVATHGRGLWTADVTNAAGLISGTVNVGPGYLGSLNGLQFDMDIRNVGSLTSIMTKTVTLNGAGAYTVDPDLPAGTYDIALSGSHWLRKLRYSQAISGAGTTNVNFSLINGNCDGNDFINTDDYLILSSAFDTALGDPGYDARADLDGNNLINTDDYLILSDNFDSFGDD